LQHYSDAITELHGEMLGYYVYDNTLHMVTQRFEVCLQRGSVLILRLASPFMVCINCRK